MSFVDCNHFKMGCFIVARFVLTSASRCSSAIAELLVSLWAYAQTYITSDCDRQTDGQMNIGLYQIATHQGEAPHWRRMSTVALCGKTQRMCLVCMPVPQRVCLAGIDFVMLFPASTEGYIIAYTTPSVAVAGSSPFSGNSAGTISPGSVVDEERLLVARQ